ncbi:TAXI family TRAP transporter solute-binding subunit [Caproiciproducens sp. NJN-50]|uniref:TAXI family TRAP transporter solute-binding subunit n=1 Tax=Acutalibacteraceae TaxID=3082771 RepID=UPI000FFDFD7F|nr:MULTISPECIES: TAXI family TRAP transporter solute-binding subunit [Acutalibacteraceae]QAT49462.1 TAXI family TRAP transporter solute-binding subunit [Caproiciproducens sp. NJN-50]
MKKLVAIAAILALLVSSTACGSGSSPSVSSASAGNASAQAGSQTNHPQMALSVGTGPSGSTNYAVISSMGSLIQKRYPNYIFSPEISTGSAQNVQMIVQKTCQMGVCMADAAYAAYNGEREFDKNTKGKINFVMSGYETVFNQFVLKNSQIKNFKDLKGKKCGVGKGTMEQFYWPMLLEMNGMSEDDVKTVSLSLSDIADEVSDGTLDYGVFVTSVPNSDISNLALTKGIRMLGFDEDVRKSIIEKYPYFNEATISKDSYNLDSDVVTLGTRNTIVASPDLDPQVVYDFLDVVLSSQDDLKLVSVSAAEFNKENALLDSKLIPMHPGATKYYKEKGIIS